MSPRLSNIAVVPIQGAPRCRRYSDTELLLSSSNSPTSTLPPYSSPSPTGYYYSSTQKAPVQISVSIHHPTPGSSSPPQDYSLPSPITGNKSPTNAPYIAPRELPFDPNVPTMFFSSLLNTEGTGVICDQDSDVAFDPLSHSHGPREQVLSSTCESRPYQYTSRRSHSFPSVRMPSPLIVSRSSPSRDEVNES